MLCSSKQFKAGAFPGKGTQVVLFISQVDGWSRKARRGRVPRGQGVGEAAFALSDAGGEGPALDGLSTT